MGPPDWAAFGVARRCGVWAWGATVSATGAPSRSSSTNASRRFLTSRTSPIWQRTCRAGSRRARTSTRAIARLPFSRLTADIERLFNTRLTHPTRAIINASLLEALVTIKMGRKTETQECAERGVKKLPPGPRKLQTAAFADVCEFVQV